MWVCPECGRKFARNRQSHSCEQYDGELLFIGKDLIVRELYNNLISRILEFGEIEVHAGKYGLTVRRLSGFLSIMLEKSHLTLIFISREPIDEFPVYQSAAHGTGRHSNAIKIESLDEVDDQLLRWLRQAWELAG